MDRYLAQAAGTFDLVHNHSVFLWPTTSAAKQARRKNVPYVISPRGMLVRDLIERRSKAIKQAWITIFERRNIARASAVHVTSALEAAGLRELGLAPRKIIDIPNGFDLPKDSPQALQDGSLPPHYLLFLGRISWKKGLDRLVRAMPHAPEARVVIAGNDEEALWPKIEALARELGVASRIYYIGYVGGRDKFRLISGATALVLPSYSENFGNAVLEGLALGIPAIVTPEVGLAEMISAQGCGLVVSGEPETLGSAIAKAVGNRSLSRELGGRGKSAAAAYSWSAIAGRFEQEYRALIDGARDN
jgi:glycosyltransferase involved in cell wall biosynthesis